MLDYCIIGNCKTAALVKKNGSIDWMCFPTFSSPSIFAKILDEDKGGSLSIKPKGKYKVTQQYIPSTAILETTFDSRKSAFKVIDFFPRYRKLLSKNHEKLVKQNRLIRIIKPLKGNPRLQVVYGPRPNYALDECEVVEHEGSLCLTNGQLQFALISNISYQEITGRKEIELSQTKYIIVGQQENAEEFSVRRCLHLMHATKKYWSRFVQSLILPELNKEVIIRSAITLKLLTYSETGAIIAAPTTSIPEEIGTSRTWDYRYCWVRDAALAADALKKIGRGYEAKKLMEFIINRALENDYIQIMYGINGETRLQEKDLRHLAGFHGSRPVRIGNDAYKQLQHDIFGEVLDLMYLYFVYYELETRLTHRYWRFIRYVTNQIKFSWEKKDSSIWEFRERYDHYTYSKFMCYIGIDRAIKIAQHFKREQHLKELVDLREEIREDILKHGYNEKVNAFTMTYGKDELDASLLHMAYHEFLDAADPRMINTIKAVYKNLRTGCLVQRYAMKDDLGISRSAFTICSFWLVEALQYIGEIKKAQKMYAQLLKHANHLGLFSEDIDIATGRLLGNFPQSYTHIALINSSILLSEWGTKRKKWEKTEKEWF